MTHNYPDRPVVTVMDPTAPAGLSIDTIRALFTYGIITFVIIGGMVMLFLRAGQTDPSGLNTVLGGFIGAGLVFLTGHPALGTLPDSYALGGPIPGEPGKVFGAFEALRLNVSLPSGFPNGRLVTDDVVDTALSAMGGLLINGTVVSDGVDASGLYFLDTFPFLGDPWTGDDHPNGTHDL